MTIFNLGMEIRKSEQRKLGVHIFVTVDQQGSQEQLEEAAINHSTPGNSPTCASPKIQEIQWALDTAVPCSTWAAASKLGRSQLQPQT